MAQHKIRKARRSGAALRALRSAPKSVRKALKQTVGVGTKREKRVAAGKILRKSRIARSTNPNTGKGSLAKHTVRRAVRRGLIGKGTGKKSLQTLNRIRSRGAGGKKAVETFGRSTPGRLANRGKAVTKITKALSKSRGKSQSTSAKSTFSRLAKLQVHKNKSSGASGKGASRARSSALAAKKISAKNIKSRITAAGLSRGRAASGRELSKGQRRAISKAQGAKHDAGRGSPKIDPREAARRVAANRASISTTSARPRPRRHL